MIKVTLKNSENLIDEKHSAFISFPYHQTLIRILRNQPVKYYHEDKREWEVPLSEYKKLYGKLKSWEVKEIDLTDGDTTKEEVLLPEDFSFKTEPFEHQRETVMYGLTNDSFILADEPGTGKTKGVIDLSIAHKLSRGYKHTLIICCVNSHKWNWRKEVAIHSNESSILLGLRTRKRTGKEYIGSNKDKIDDLNLIAKGAKEYFIITNIETIRDPKITSKLVQLIKKDLINIVAVDEFQYCKNPTSQQGKSLLKLKAEVKIPMTGTPVVTSPADCYMPLKWIGQEAHTYSQFKEHYFRYGGFGNHELLGYKNMPELRDRMQSIMLRRKKVDVLDLPPKIYKEEYVEMTSSQEKIYKAVKQDLMEVLDKLTGTNITQLAEVIRLRQVTSNPAILTSEEVESAKIERMVQMVEELRQNNRKAIIFSNWVPVVQYAFERLATFNPALIIGGLGAGVEEQKKRFQEDEDCGVIIGTIPAMGTGHTLTAASDVIFIDEPWSRLDKEQCEDRGHRIGTKGNLTVTTLLTLNTIDEKVSDIVKMKGAVSDFLIDGYMDFTNPNILKFLLQ